MIIWVIGALAAIFVVAMTLDLWIGRHPFKKADARTEKYRYKGF